MLKGTRFQIVGAVTVMQRESKRCENKGRTTNDYFFFANNSSTIVKKMY